MALVSDLEEAKKMWKNSSFSARAFIVISTFLAVSSITSLSDTIFKWKGFILDGLNFYREFIRFPLCELISKFEIHLEFYELDIYVIVLLMHGAFVRTQNLKFEHSDIGLFTKVFLAILSGVMILGVSYYLVHFEPMNSSLQYVTFILIMFLLPILQRYSSKERVAYYTPIILSFIVVFILAAINIGLRKVA
jgi:hypothetical protein